MFNLDQGSTKSLASIMLLLHNFDASNLKVEEDKSAFEIQAKVDLEAKVYLGSVIIAQIQV